MNLAMDVPRCANCTRPENEHDIYGRCDIKALCAARAWPLPAYRFPPPFGYQMGDYFVFKTSRGPVDGRYTTHACCYDRHVECRGSTPDRAVCLCPCHPAFVYEDELSHDSRPEGENQ